MPVSPWAQATFARILWLAGESEAAIDALLESLRLAPYEFGLRRRLVEMLLEQQRAAEAGRILAPALRSLPHDPELKALQSIVQTQLSEQQRAPRHGDSAARERE
jgi:predicted Zn-dependent protease